ncbi:hypothetical protein GUJ93_ZPchr0008g13727 [Zizania palustris]|uniref:Uncharacterized protein n=1 Tax=Zizania palustris TaxID=103762 RepID=A0A8J5RUI6_ZIZPA|nr:hypothetical protein GUJ93_ZPchr0008g13727 [Zizania palustris]
MQWYSGDVGGYPADMLMLDGCFIVELLLLECEDKARADNYIRIMWNSTYYDLLLVDNQIPFFVVERIFLTFRNRKENHAFKNTQLLHLVNAFFNHRKGQFSWAPANPSTDVLPAAAANYQIPGGDKSEQSKIFDVKFGGNGGMTIPRFEINFGSKILLANLFASEQIERQPCDKLGAVTSYIVLMNALINTADDVMVLQRAGILDNLLSSEKEVASFFNELGRCTMLDMREHRYSGMFDDVNKYWMSHLNFSKYLAIFRLKHLRNPWTCISLLGAILLVIFSFTSMIIAILNFLKYR